MSDWRTPFPLCMARRPRRTHGWTSTATHTCDFCLGDTGAMFGHCAAPVARAIAEQASARADHDAARR